MIIDGRELQIEDTLKKIREFLNNRRSLDDSVEVLLKSPEDAKKVKGYVSMNGCTTEFRKANGYYTMLVTGGSCRCG